MTNVIVMTRNTINHMARVQIPVERARDQHSIRLYWHLAAPTGLIPESLEPTLVRRLSVPAVT